MVEDVDDNEGAERLLSKVGGEVESGIRVSCSCGVYRPEWVWVCVCVCVCGGGGRETTTQTRKLFPRPLLPPKLVVALLALLLLLSLSFTLVKRMDWTL